MGQNNFIIKPHTISFLTTYQCTSACKNCCFHCNPKMKQRLTLDEMKLYLDQSIKYYEDSLKVLVLTGGECTILDEDLLSIIEYGSKYGLIVRIVTNGHWAMTFEKARIMIAKLIDAGLKEINFSTGDDLQEFVPYDNIVNGAVASLERKITCVINVETHDNAKFSSKQFLTEEKLKPYFNNKDGNSLIIENGLWIPFSSNSDVTNNSYTWVKRQAEQRCDSLFNTITINPFSKMIACCGLTSEYISCLRLGNLKKYTVKELYENQFNDLIKLWLFVDGPAKVLKYVQNGRGKICNPRGHVCEICASIFKDSENIKYILEHQNEIKTNVLLKYSLITNPNN